MRVDPVTVEPLDVSAGSMAPGDTYDLDGTWVKVQPSGSFGTPPAGKCWFVRLEDGAQRESDDTATVKKVARKCVGL